MVFRPYKYLNEWTRCSFHYSPIKHDSVFGKGCKAKTGAPTTTTTTTTRPSSNLCTKTVEKRTCSETEAVSIAQPRGHLRCDSSPFTNSKQKCVQPPELFRLDVTPPGNNFLPLLEELSGFVEIPPPPLVKPPQMQQALGRFHKTSVYLPFSGDTMDPRLLDDTVTPVAETMIEQLKHHERHFILLGKSGDGKTRAIFDVARRFFTVYMECVLNTDERVDITKDKLFSSFATTVERRIKNGENPADVVKLNFLLELAARILYLQLLLRHYPSVTPQQYLVAQLNGGRTVTRSIHAQLKGAMPEVLTDLIHWSIAQLQPFTEGRLVIGVDEAGLAHNHLIGKFSSPRTKKPRGLLTPMANIIRAFDLSTIYAATNRSLGQGETLQSDIGKLDKTQILTHFDQIEDEDMAKEYLQVGQFTLGDAIPELVYLVGRHRIGANVLTEIAQIENARLTKQEALMKAISKSVAAHRTKLTSRFTEEVNALKSTAKVTTIPILERLYTSNKLFGGRLAFVFDQAEQVGIDYVQIGLASLRRWHHEEQYTVEIFERLAVEVIDTVLGNQDPLRPLQRKLERTIAEYSNPAAKGEPFEILSLGTLCLLSKRGLTVAELAKRFLGTSVELPSWVQGTTLYITSVASASNIGLKDELEYATRALSGDPKMQTTMLSKLSNLMRPDGLMLRMIGNSKSFWALSVSTKLYYESFPPKNITADLNSTDVTTFYYDANGESVSKAQAKHAAWQSLLTSYKHAGSLRIHIILPKMASKLCRVEGNDIILYVDMNNAALLFDAATMQLLQKYVKTYKEPKENKKGDSQELKPIKFHGEPRES